MSSLHSPILPSLVSTDSMLLARQVPSWHFPWLCHSLLACSAPAKQLCTGASSASYIAVILAATCRGVITICRAFAAFASCQAAPQLQRLKCYAQQTRQTNQRQLRSVVGQTLALERVAAASLAPTCKLRQMEGRSVLESVPLVDPQRTYLVLGSTDRETLGELQTRKGEIK
eukprot:6458688-Amphidinium_carterae.1